MNYCRSSPQNGPPDLSSKALWKDEKYLKPVIEGDVLLYTLDGVLEEMEKSLAGISDDHEEMDSEKKALLTRVETLTGQMEKMETNWRNYKAAVDDQLDKRWQNTDDLQVHSCNTLKKRTAHRSEDKDYFKGYSYTGTKTRLHMLQPY